MVIAKNTGGGDFKMVPEGMHTARCYRIVDLGTQHNVKWDKFQHKVMITLECYGEECQTDDGKPLAISMWHTVSLNEKANLRRDLESWRGKKFTKEELNGFVVDNLIGAPAMINVIHNESGDKTYANIASISPVPKGMEVPKPINDPILFSLDKPDMDVFDNLPNGIKAMIEDSIEWKGRHGKSPTKSVQAPAPVDPMDDLDSDIPF